MLTLDKGTHTYTLDGVVIPSVSQILSCVAVRATPDSFWRSVSGSEMIVDSETSANFGNALHAIAAMTVQGKKFQYDPQMEPWVQGLQKFLKDFDFLKPIAVEQSIYSKKYGFAGTPDLIADSTRRWYVIDWKTSTGNMKHWKWQTAAYEQAARETYPETYKHIKHCTRLTVRIFENGYDAQNRTGHPEDWMQFLSFLNTFKFGG